MFCFANLCRLCLNGGDDMVDFKSCDFDNVPFLNKLLDIVPWIMPTTDSSQRFPTLICKLCQDNVRQICKFIGICNNSYKLLHQYCLQFESVENKWDTTNYSLQIKLCNEHIPSQDVEIESDCNLLSIEETNNETTIINSSEYELENSNILEFRDQYILEKNNGTSATELELMSPVQSVLIPEEQYTSTSENSSSTNLLINEKNRIDSTPNLKQVNGKPKNPFFDSDSDPCYASDPEESENNMQKNVLYYTTDKIASGSSQPSNNKNCKCPNYQETCRFFSDFNRHSGIYTEKHPRLQSLNNESYCCPEMFQYSNDFKYYGQVSTKKNQTPERNKYKFYSKSCPLLTNHATHSRIDSDESEDKRRYKCNMCVKKFLVQSSLKYHQKFDHFNNKIFICHLCDRRFTESCKLRKHLQTHREAKQ